MVNVSIGEIIGGGWNKKEEMEKGNVFHKFIGFPCVISGWMIDIEVIAIQARFYGNVFVFLAISFCLMLNWHEKCQCFLWI